MSDSAGSAGILQGAGAGEREGGISFCVVKQQRGSRAEAHLTKRITPSPRCTSVSVLPHAGICVAHAREEGESDEATRQHKRLFPPPSPLPNHGKSSTNHWIFRPRRILTDTRSSSVSFAWYTSADVAPWMWSPPSADT